MTERRAVAECQRRLLLVWGGLGAVALIVVLVQTAPGGAYEGSAGDVWDWFLPTVVPTFSLMLGTIVAQARAPDDGATVDAFTYRVTLWTSTLYLALVIVLLLMYAQSRTPVVDLRGSGKVVTSLYALVGTALGAFFMSKKSDA